MYALIFSVSFLLLGLRNLLPLNRLSSSLIPTIIAPVVRRVMQKQFHGSIEPLSKTSNNVEGRITGTRTREETSAPDTTCLSTLPMSDGTIGLLHLQVRINL